MVFGGGVCGGHGIGCGFLMGSWVYVVGLCGELVGGGFVVVMVWVLGFWWVVGVCGGCGLGAGFLVDGWVYGWVVIWNIFWDGEFLAMGCGG